MRVPEMTTNLTARSPEGFMNMNDSMEIIILMVMLSVFSVVGSIGNGMVIFVFQRVRDKSTAQVFIISMAVIDLFTCMVIIPLTMFVEYINYDIKYDLLCKLYQFLITSKIPMSAFIMVAIAFDRYFCICHPLRKIITRARAKSIVICLAVLASFFGIFTSLFYSVYQLIERVNITLTDEVAGTNFSKFLEHVDEFVYLDGSGRSHSAMRDHMSSVVRSMGVTFNVTTINYLPVTFAVVYIGSCNPSSVIFGSTIFHIYQRTYMAVYPMCLISVMVLYFMIYRFMCHRRSKKLQQKLIMCSYVNGDGTYENTRLVSGEVEDTRRNSKNKTMPTADNPDHFPRSISVTNGFNPSPICLRDSQDESNMTGLHSAQTNEKNGSNFLSEADPLDKIPSSPTIITSIVTPTDADDNTPILSFGNNFNSSNNSFRHNTTDRCQLVSVRRHSRLPEQKYQWHKKRDSMRRYKEKANKGRTHYNSDADRLREENRSANVRTALMLFTVTLVFMVAFVPAWVMAHRLIPHNVPVFYLYFIYNVANPFIYAFMNHIFKDYMRKMFTCRQLTISNRRGS